MSLLVHQNEEDADRVQSTEPEQCGCRTVLFRPNEGDCEDRQDDAPKREQWSSTKDFMLICVGYSVGLGNLWRFPYLCGQNGGGVFLLPYVAMMLLLGFPLLMLEQAIGLNWKTTPLKLYGKAAPMFAGIGCAMIALSIYITSYYNVLLAWAVRYLFTSAYSAVIRESVPWAHCGNDYNNISCIDHSVHCNGTESVYVFGQCLSPSSPVYWPNSTLLTNAMSGQPMSAQDVADYRNEAEENRQSSGKQYFNHILNASASFDGLGAPKWDLAICLLVCWLIVCACLVRGVKSSGKAVYFTATFPYVCLLILLLRGVFLDGASDGLRYFMTGIDPVLTKQIENKMAHFNDTYPNNTTSAWEALDAQYVAATSPLGKYNVWADAASQVMFSLSLGSGGMVTVASKKSKRTVTDIAGDGPTLAFVIYPEGLAQLPGSWLWSIIFFGMLFLMGIDSQLVDVETVLTAISDWWPKLRNDNLKSALVSGVCAAAFLVGLVYCTPQGKFILGIIDDYPVGDAQLIIAFSEVMLFAWVYGVRRLMRDMKMLDERKCRGRQALNTYLNVCWAFVTPLLIAALITSMVWEQLNTSVSVVKYAISCTALASILVFIPAMAFYHLFVAQYWSSKKLNWNKLLGPTDDTPSNRIELRVMNRKSVEDPD